jgi:chaperone modulatory protein CbpM
MTRRSPTLDALTATTRPRTEVYLSFEQVAEAAGLSHLDLHRLVRSGLVEPVAARGTLEFTADTPARLRRMLRLRRELGVNFTGAVIIVDLLERIERLEASLR